MEGKGEGFDARRPMEREGKAPHARRPMEGKGEGYDARRPMEREGEAPHACRPMEGKGEGSLLPLFIFPQTNFLKPFIF